MSENKSFSESNHLEKNTDNQVATLFEHARAAEQKSLDISDSETREAYQKLQSRITTKKNADYTFLKYAAAALILIGVIGTAYILTPKNITVPDGTTRTVNLSDGTTIILNSGSELSQPRWFNIWSRTVFLDGEAFFEVTQNGDPFRVETVNAIVTVMGTKFNVRYWSTETQKKTSVFLQEGSVSFSSKASENKAIILQPGQESSLSGNQVAPVQPHQADQSKSLAWMQNGLAFNNQPLSDVFNEIGRRFDVTIQTEPALLGNEKLTIYISQIKSVEQILDDISRAKNLQYSKEDNIFTVRRP